MSLRENGHGQSRNRPHDAPAAAAADAINRDFGSLEKFRARFDEVGAKVFGSGWVWLVKTQQDGGKLEVLATAGHGNPLMQDRFPLPVDDVWEHAYYLKHENRRAEYLKGWRSVVNCREVARRFENAAVPLEQRWAGGGGLVLGKAA